VDKDKSSETLKEKQQKTTDKALQKAVKYQNNQKALEQKIKISMGQAFQRQRTNQSIPEKSTN